MITFNFNDAGGQVSLEVRSRAEHIHMLVEDFKMFLVHAGYHPDNVNAIEYNGEFEPRQGLPQQLELPL